MKTIQVNTTKEIKQFVNFPLNLYKDNSFYVPALSKGEIKRISNILNNQGNDYKAAFWLLKCDNKVCGRIGAYIQLKIDGSQAKFGWFDCVENNNVAQSLLHEAEKWAKKNGASMIHGPLGLTSFDKSGVLVEGFKEIPTSYSCYNFPYYSKLIEANGYKSEFDWVEYLFSVPEKLPEKIKKGCDLVKKRYGVKLIEANTISAIKNYKEDIRTTLNKSYERLEGFSVLSKDKFDSIFEDFAPIVVPDLTALLKDMDGNFIGFGLAVPSFSEALIKARGKLFPFGFWHIMQAKKKNDTADLLLIAIKPEYQKKGVHALIFEKIIKSMINRGIKYVESTKELESNKHIQNLWQGFNYKQHKRSRCFIKELQ